MPTESELVRLAMQRDAAAFGQLYELHLDSIYRYIYYRVGNATEAEDLTEQVFLKAWEHMAAYDERGLPFSAWLYRVARNAVIDYHRTRKPMEDLSEELVDKRGDPQETVELRLEMAEVTAALRTLPPEQQEIIVLRFIQGCSHAQAAAIMGKTEGALRALQYRALAALHQALGREGRAGASMRQPTATTTAQKP
jgi:RNA polymerase sigma-70 factor (ECF subfamily)